MPASHLLFGVMLVCAALKPAYSAVTEEQLEKMAAAVRRSCLQKVDTTEDLALGIRRGEFPDDPNVACYASCALKAMAGLKNGALNGKLLMRNVDATMPAEVIPRVKEAIKGCLTQEFDAPDVCQLAYRYAKCVYEADPEVFFFP